MVAGTASAESCPCDCDDNGAVRVHELQTGVNIALERAEMQRCPAADADESGAVEVGDLVSGVNAAMTGCVQPVATPTPIPRLTIDELDDARRLWAAAGYSHYEYRYRLGCFCYGPLDVIIEVLDGDIVAFRDPEAGNLVNVEFRDLFFTVPELFDRIESEIDRAHWLRVVLDETTGYPIEFSVDPVLEIADDELSTSISDLHPIDNTCSDADECDGFADTCVEPGGFVGCGVCFPAEDLCDSDAECGGNAQICAPIGLSAMNCACDPSATVCQQGCWTDGDCSVGQSCDASHHCVAQRCNGDESCPNYFECILPPDSRTGECRRRLCSEAADCSAGGFCVGLQCYASPGRCEPIPP
jgi:hypothetical protein